MGFLLFDEETQQRFVCDAPCPSWLMKVWDDPSCNPWLLSGWANPWKKRKTHINALELLAIVVAVWTVDKQFLQGRQVVFFAITLQPCPQQYMDMHVRLIWPPCQTCCIWR